MSQYYSLKDRMYDYRQTNKFTPDIQELYRYESHFVFVYGTLKSGHIRNSILTNCGAKFQGLFRTKHPTYEMVNTAWNFPAVFQYQNMTNPGHIKGELYLVPTEAMLKLDKIECNESLFCRDTVDVVGFRDKRETPETLPAWMYCGVNTFWRARPYSIYDMPVRKDKLGSYYYYTKEDHQEMYDKIMKDEPFRIAS